LRYISSAVDHSVEVQIFILCVKILSLFNNKTCAIDIVNFNAVENGVEQKDSEFFFV
jgi:hypothetical protein